MAWRNEFEFRFLCFIRLRPDILPVPGFLVQCFAQSWVHRYLGAEPVDMAPAGPRGPGAEQSGILWAGTKPLVAWNGPPFCGRSIYLHHGNCKCYKSGPCGVALLLERSRRSLPAPHPVLLPPHPSSSDILLLPALSLVTTQLLSFGRYLWHSHSISSCVAWEIWTGTPSSIWQKAQSTSSWDQPLEGELGSLGRKRGSEKRDRRGCALHNGRERSREGTLGKVFKTNLPAVLGTEPVSSPACRVWGKKAHKAPRRELFSYVRHFPSDVPFLLGSQLWTGTLVVMEPIKGSQKRAEKYRGTHLRCSLLSMRPWMNDSNPPLLTFTLSIPTPLNNVEPGDATASSHFFPSFLQETLGHWPRWPAVWCCDGLGSSSINSKSHQHTFIALICLQSTFLFISSFDQLFA